MKHQSYLQGSYPPDGLGDLKVVVLGQHGHVGLQLGVVEDLLGDAVQPRCPLGAREDLPVRLGLRDHHDLRRGHLCDK